MNRPWDDKTWHELRDAAWEIKAATYRRDDLIHKMREEGASLRLIAEAANLTAPGVAKILKRS